MTEQLPTKRYRACTLSDLSLNHPIRVVVNGVEVFVVRDQNGVFAMSDRCGHMCAPLHQGDFTDTLVVCGLHGAAFHVATGEVAWEAILPPPISSYSSDPNDRLRRFGLLIEAVKTLPVASFPVTLEGDEVWVDIPNHLIAQVAQSHTDIEED